MWSKLCKSHFFFITLHPKYVTLKIMNLPKNITTIQDVKDFANYLVNTEHLNFNSDEDFRNYISYETHRPTYSEAEAVKRNNLMEQCFRVCESEEVDIYEVMGEYLMEALNLNV